VIGPGYAKTWAWKTSVEFSLKDHSLFIFNIIVNIYPTNLAGKPISKGYFDERTPASPNFFQL